MTRVFGAIGGVGFILAFFLANCSGAFNTHATVGQGLVAPCFTPYLGNGGATPNVGNGQSVGDIGNGGQCPSSGPATPPPPVLAPTPIAFANPSSTPAVLTLTDTGYTGAFTITTTPGGVVSPVPAGIGPSTTVTVGVVAGQTGSGTMTVSNGYTQTTVPYAVGTPGPLACSPTLLLFLSPNAAAQTCTITDPGYGGPWTVASSPLALSSPTVAANVVTVNTTGTIGTGTVGITDPYNTTTVAVQVSPTPTPMPTATDLYIVGAAAGRNYASSETLTFSGTATGDKLVADLSANSGATINVPTGWTAADNQTPGGSIWSHALIYQDLTAPLTSTTFTSSTGNIIACVIDVRGAAAGAPTFTNNSQTTGTTNALAPTPAPTTSALVVGMVTAVTGVTNTAWASYMPQAGGSQYSGGYSCSSAYGPRSADSTSAQTDTATFTGTVTTSSSYLVMFPPATAVGSTTFPAAGWVAFPPGNNPPQQSTVATDYGTTPFSTTAACPVTKYVPGGSYPIGNTYGCLMSKSAAVITQVMTANGGPQNGGMGFIDNDLGSLSYYTGKQTSCYAYDSCNSSGNDPSLYISHTTDSSAYLLNGGCNYSQQGDLAKTLVYYVSGWVEQLGPDRHTVWRTIGVGSVPNWGQEVQTIQTGIISTTTVTANNGYIPAGNFGSAPCPTTAAGTYQGTGANGAVTFNAPATPNPGYATVPGTASVTDVGTSDGTGLRGSAGQLSFFGGAIRAQEVANDDGALDTTGINHAGLIIESCETYPASNNTLYPAGGNDGSGGNECTDASKNLDYGGRLVLTSPPTNIGVTATNGCNQFDHAYLKMMWFYGAFMNDVGATSGSTTAYDAGLQLIVSPDIDDTFAGSSVWASVISTMVSQGATGGHWYRPGGSTPGSNARWTYTVPDGACNIWTGANSDGHSSNWGYVIPPR